MRNTKASDVNSQHSSIVSHKDPTSIKDKIYQRLLLKMGKQFGDDPETIKIIAGVIKLYVKDGSQIQAKDLDNLEQDIFKRLCNTNNNIALDAFHPRLVEKAERKKLGGFDQFGGTKFEKKEFLLEKRAQEEPITPIAASTTRAQTSNQGFRKHSNFFKLNSRNLQNVTSVQA